MAELMTRILRAYMDRLIRRYWKPRIGDRVEFLIIPRDNSFGHYYYIIEANSRATITRIIEPNWWNARPDVVFSMDDGREITVHTFNRSNVRVIGLMRSRKKAKA